MWNRVIRYFHSFAFLFLLGFFACDGNDPSINAGRLRVKLTDATDISIKELYINLDKIAVYATDTASMEGEWVELAYNGGKYNLLELFNEKNVLLVDQYFPGGKTIRRVRLEFGHDNYFLTYTADTFPLQLPAAVFDGLVIDLMEPIVVVPYVISSLIIDVNAAFSIRETDENYFLDPSVRAFPEEYGASLRGTVSPVGSAAFVAIIQEPETLFTLPGPDGKFRFPGLQKGSWEVYIGALEGSFRSDTTFVWDIDTTGIINMPTITLPPLPVSPTPDE